MSFWNDIKTTVRLTGEIRKARENGSDIRGVLLVPARKLTYWAQTMEFCLMRDREMEKAILAVFNTFPEPVQHSLTFAPKGPGAWLERARFWQQCHELKPQPSITPSFFRCLQLVYRFPIDNRKSTRYNKFTIYWRTRIFKAESHT